MKVLFMLLPEMRSSLHCFKGKDNDIQSLEEKGTCKSLSLGFCQVTCDNQHQCCQVVAEGKLIRTLFLPLWYGDDRSFRRIL